MNTQQRKDLAQQIDALLILEEYDKANESLRLLIDSWTISKEAKESFKRFGTRIVKIYEKTEGTHEFRQTTALTQATKEAFTSICNLLTNEMLVESKKNLITKKIKNES